MSVTQSLITTNFHVEMAKRFVESVATDNYFTFAGKPTPYPGSDSIITTPDDSVQTSHLDVYNDMVFAKKIGQDDAVHMINKYTWTSGTFYDEYDHQDPDLYNKKFYVVTQDGDEWNVYKCIDNASNSTVQTVSTQVPSGKDTEPYKESDNYWWKYMYTISKADYDKFATTAYIPVTANADVIAAAIPGTVDQIHVEQPGKGYNNYLENQTFRLSDLSVQGINTQYGAPETAEATDNYYAGCVLTITEGSAAAGQSRRIVDYKGTGQKIFVLDSPFNPAPTAGDKYEVMPYVYVWGDGTETTPAAGRAIIDSTAANSILEIEMLDIGAGYRYGESYPGQTSKTIPITIDSVFIDLPVSITNDTVNYEPAVLRPIISPPGGHGSDPIAELGARRVCISAKYANTESGSIPIENDFRQVGIIKDPLFDNVRITHTDKIGNFNLGDTVYQFKQVKLSGNVTISSDSFNIIKTDQGKISQTVNILNGGTGYTLADTIVIDSSGTGGSGCTATSFTVNGSGTITSVTISQGSGYLTPPTVTVLTTTGSDAQITLELANPQMPLFKDAFEVGDYFLVNKGTSNYVSTVASVPYDYQVTATSKPTISGSDFEISALTLQARGTVTSSLSGITLSNVTGQFDVGAKIISLDSGATAIIDTVKINDKTQNIFNTAVQLTRLVGSYDDSTPFEEDEQIAQISPLKYATATGYVHHIDMNVGEGTDDILYISNKFGIFNNDPAGVRPITGQTTDAQLKNLTNKYFGDFVVDSGKILYLENLDAITRNGNKSEIIKIILEF